jgi:hypothetical protein
LTCNAKKLSRILQASALAAEDRWLQGAEKSGFDNGLTKGGVFATRGGRMKLSGTARGKTSLPLIGKKWHQPHMRTPEIAAKSPARTSNAVGGSGISRTSVIESTVP